MGRRNRRVFSMRPSAMYLCFSTSTLTKRYSTRMCGSRPKCGVGTGITAVGPFARVQPGGARNLKRLRSTANRMAYRTRPAHPCRSGVKLDSRERGVIDDVWTSLCLFCMSIFMSLCGQVKNSCSLSSYTKLYSSRNR